MAFINTGKALKQRKLNWDDCKAGRRPTRLCSLLGTNPYFQIKKHLLTLYFDPRDKSLPVNHSCDNKIQNKEDIFDLVT